MLDIVEGRGDGLSLDHFQPKGFEGTLADINAPNAFGRWHIAILRTMACRAAIEKQEYATSTGLGSPSLEIPTNRDW
jgi:hypothetical protein